MASATIPSFGPCFLLKTRHVKSFFPYCCAAVIALVVTCVVWVAFSQESKRLDKQETTKSEMTSNAASLSDTVRRVQRATGGQILGAERVPYDGQSINRVKYMDERGRVRYIDEPVTDTRDTSLQSPRRGNHH